MVHFPPSVEVLVVNPPLTACQQFCAYHSSFQTSQLGGAFLYYGVIPDLGSDGCQYGGCGTGTVFENTCSAASHEVAESITDAMNNATAPTDYPLAWYDNEANSQGELADVCDQQNDTLGVNGVTGCGAADAGCYTVQQVFSRVVWNADPADQPNVPACVASRFDVDDYSIAFRPNTLTLVRGATAVVPILTALTQGNPLPLTLSAEAPPGVDAGFDNPTPTVGEAVNLTVSSDADAPLVQDGILVVRATGTATHSAALLLHLLPQNAWNLVLSPATALLFPGGSQTFAINGNVTAGSAEPVTLSATVAGLPPGVSAAFSTLTLTPGVSSAFVTLSASADAPGAPSTGFSVTGVSASQPGGHPSLASIQVDNPPSVSITSPSAGATVSNYQVVRVVTNPGLNSSVRTINFTLDDNVELSVGSASTFFWNTEEAANGSHTVHVRTFDADGAGGSASVTITVANASSGGCTSAGGSPSTVALVLVLGSVWMGRGRPAWGSRRSRERPGAG
ncbi:MAG: Ig-like domain-containing protein [Myxococcaceae bacterium]